MHSKFSAILFKEHFKNKKGTRSIGSCDDASTHGSPPPVPPEVHPVIQRKRKCRGTSSPAWESDCRKWLVAQCARYMDAMREPYFSMEKKDLIFHKPAH